MKKICLAVGHWQIESLTSDSLRSWRDVNYLRTSTGASGERDWHWNEWMPRLRDKLNASGNFYVYIASGIYDPNVYNQDFDLWISGHYDGGGTGDRCMISAPNRSTQPAYLNSGAFSEAERFCAVWKSVYPDMVGVPNRDDLISAGMLDYYAFDYPLMDTPSVIVEHFNHSSIKGGELKANPELVAEADYQAILKFFNLVTPPVQPDVYEITYKGTVLATYAVNPVDEMARLNQQITTLNTQVALLQAQVGSLTGDLAKQTADNADLVAQVGILTGERDDAVAGKTTCLTSLEKSKLEIGEWIIKYDELKKACQNTDVLKRFSKRQLLRYIILGHV